MPIKLADLLGVEASISRLAASDWLMCHVPGKPVAKGRPLARRRHGQIRLLTPEATERGEAWVRQCWLNQCGHVLLTGALEVRLRICTTVPKSYNAVCQALAAQDELRPTVKPDLDNVCKLALDALNGIAWLDDCQVVRTTIDKCFALPSAGPCLWIAVREWKKALTLKDWLDD